MSEDYKEANLEFGHKFTPKQMVLKDLTIKQLCDICERLIGENTQLLRRTAELEEKLAAAEKMREALEQLARLGNGDEYGNSDGNIIAQQALKAYEEVGR